MSNQQVVKSHIEFFADDKGNLTTESMNNGHYDQGINGLTVKLKSRAIHNMMDNSNNFNFRGKRRLSNDTNYHKCPFKRPHNVATLLRITNPARTGIWNVDGTFNQTVFDQLVDRSDIQQIGKDGSGEKIIMKKHFMEHLKERRQGKELGNACHIFKFVPVSWTRVTQGSIDELFEYFSDIIFDGEKAFTESRLREFYTNPAKLMRQRKQKHLTKSVLV